MDGETVNPEVSTGTPAPAVETTAAVPMEEQIKAAVQEALKKQEPEIARRIQSEADKRVEPLRRRLTDAERRAQMLEGTLATLPHNLGPDADPMLVQRVQNQGLQAKLSVYEQERQAQIAAQREQEAKDMVLQEARAEVAELGLDPDDTRVQYDLNQPDAQSFRKKVMASVRAALKEDNAKELDSRAAKIAADVEAKLRKATGVDSHDTTGTGGKPTFTKAQFLDRKFYKENREAMDLAAKEGRVQ